LIVEIFGIGPMELIVILLLLMMFFGPDRLPEMGAKLGKAVRSMRRATRDFSEELQQARDAIEKPAAAITAPVQQIAEPIQEVMQPFQDVKASALALSQAARAVRDPGKAIRDSVMQSVKGDKAAQGGDKQLTAENAGSDTLGEAMASPSGDNPQQDVEDRETPAQPPHSEPSDLAG
jgi:TatA/E family protein of Tat protein translocase